MALICLGNNPGAGDYYCDANFGNNIWFVVTYEKCICV